MARTRPGDADYRVHSASQQAWEDYRRKHKGTPPERNTFVAHVMPQGVPRDTARADWRHLHDTTSRLLKADARLTG
jgi:hypothetical protein